MNISPVLLLSIGCAFAFLYAMIITIGWTVTRKNRKTYHNAIGYSEVEVFDLNSFKPRGVPATTVSLENNSFTSENDEPLDLKNFDCYLVEVTSSEYPKIQKGDLIFISPDSGKIKYAFKVPDLKDFR